MVYDNGTESDLLLRSLQRALNKDKASRRITDPDFGPLFSDAGRRRRLADRLHLRLEEQIGTSVRRAKQVRHSQDRRNRRRREEPDRQRTKKDPTYLLADVEIVATYKLSNINRTRLEALLHKFFGSARLDLELKDRFGGGVEPGNGFLFRFR